MLLLVSKKIKQQTYLNTGEVVLQLLAQHNISSNNPISRQDGIKIELSDANSQSCVQHTCLQKAREYPMTLLFGVGNFPEQQVEP